VGEAAQPDRHAFAVGIHGRLADLVPLVHRREPHRGIEQPVVAALEDDVVVLAGVGTGQSQAGHHGFRARVRETHEFGSRHHAGDALGDGQLALGRKRKYTTDVHALARGFVDARIGVAEDRRAVAQAVVDILVVVDVGHARAAAVLDVDGPLLAPEAEVRGDAERQAFDGPPVVSIAPGQVSRHVSALHDRAQPRNRCARRNRADSGSI